MHGIKAMAVTAKTGGVVDAKVVQARESLLIITKEGKTIKLRVDDIRASGRSTQGVKAINLAEGDSVSSVARMVSEEIEA